MDAADPCRADPRSRSAPRHAPRSLAVDRRRGSGGRSSRSSRVSKRNGTAGSSRVIWRPTVCGSFPRPNTSSSGETRATCSCHSSTTIRATPTSCTRCSTNADRPGPELPRCPADLRELWPRWIGEGWFEWEPDGWPLWSHHHHLATWWEVRDLSNILFVHYRDLKSDPDGEIRRVAAFCDISIDEDLWPALLRTVGLDAMRDEPRGTDDPMSMTFEGGAARFFFKGEEGRCATR